jgi:hypothetical protein
MINERVGASSSFYIGEDRTVKTPCKYCKATITFSYNSVGRTGRKLPCNLDGTLHKCAEYEAQKFGLYGGQSV